MHMNYGRSEDRPSQCRLSEIAETENVIQLRDLYYSRNIRIDVNGWNWQRLLT